MTSKVSNKKVSPVMHNFMCGAKSKMKMAIIIGILHLAAAPAVIISLIASIYSKNPGEAAGDFAVIGVITTAIAGFVGIFMAIDSFSCLHKKSVVDMRLSLPLTANQRFLSNFLSGLAVYIGPFLAAQIFSLLGMAYGFIFMEGKTFLREAGFMDGKPVYSDYVCEYFSQAMPVLLKLIFCGTLAMLMLYTLTVFVTVCCGNKFESIAYTILINIMIPLTLYLVFASMFMGMYGLDQTLSEIIGRLMMYTSPAGGILAAAEWCFRGEIIGDVGMNYAVWAIVYILLTAAIFGTAFFLYKKRRAEQVSKPFVFKLLYYVISTAAIFCIYSAFYCGSSGLVSAIVTTLIVYIILEFAANRGFKKIWLSFIKYAGVMGASVLIVFAAQKTEGFGMVTRVPDASAVKSVELDYKGFYGTFPLPEEYVGHNYRTSTLTFTEKENIEIIIAAHKSRVDSRDYGMLYPAGGSVTIKYHLKNGGTLIREYYSLMADAAEILGQLDLTEEYKTQIAEKYSKCILTTGENYKQYIEAEPEFYSNWTTDLWLDNYVVNDPENDTRIKITTLLEKDFYKQLAEAYAKDIMNITEENYYRSALKNSYCFEIGGSLYRITIPESFGNTLELMDYFGFRILRVEDVSDQDLAESLAAVAKNGNLKIYTAEEWRGNNMASEGTRLHGSYCVGTGKTTNYINEVDKDLCDLYRAAEPMNIVPDNGYIIYASGYSGVIPEEMNGAAERVYSRRTKELLPDSDKDWKPVFGESTDEIFIPAQTEIYTEISTENNNG